MPVARVYLPAGPGQVVALHRDRSLPAGAHVLSVAPGSGEDVEHLAWLAAAEAAALLVAHGERRVILAADVDVEHLAPQPGSQPTVSALRRPLGLRRVVSLHIDEDPGGEMTDLLWYDITELPVLAAELST